MPGRITDGIIQGGFFFLILVTPLLFGSVYPWAHSLIQFVAALMVGAWLVRLLLLGRDGAAGVRNRRIFLPAALFFALVLFQLTPLPPRVVHLLSPETASLYTTYLSDVTPAPARPDASDVNTPAATEDAFASPRPLSLARDRTRREGMMFLTYAALLFLFINYKPERSIRLFLRRVIVCIVATGILVALIGILQKVLGADRVYGFWQPLQESRRMFMGPYINANHFAGYMELVVPPTLGLFIAWALGLNRRPQAGRQPILDAVQSPENNKILLGFLGVCVMVLTLFLSFSRAGIASFLLTLLFLFWLLGRMERRFRPEHWQAVRGRWRMSFLVFFLLLSLGALVVFALKTDGLGGLTHAARFDVWKDTLRMAGDFPVFGVGLNGFSVISPAFKSSQSPFLFTHVENDYLQMLVETGLVGLLLVLLFFVVFLREVAQLFRWRAREFVEKQDNEADPPAGDASGVRRLRYNQGKNRPRPYPMPRTNYFLFWGCAGSLISLGLHSLADFNLHIPANAILFFVLMGVLLRLVRLREPVFSFQPRRGPSR